MKRLGKFLQLTRSERRLLLSCAVARDNQARTVAVAISDLAPSFSADHGRNSCRRHESL